MIHNRNTQASGQIGRHGDILLAPADLPPGAQQQTRKGDIILALGESTGHAHRIKATPSKASIFVVGEERYLVVAKPVDLTHEEHGTLTLEPATYKVIQQRQYQPGPVPYVPMVD